MTLSKGAKLLIVMILLAAVGIILRWDYVSSEVASAFGGLFSK